LGSVDGWVGAEDAGAAGGCGMPDEEEEEPALFGTGVVGSVGVVAISPLLAVLLGTADMASWFDDEGRERE